MLPIGTTIFAASPANEAAKNQAKRYISRNKLTADDVSLRTKNDGTLLTVVTKREIELQHDGEE